MTGLEKYESFCSNVKKIMRENKISQKQMADCLGLSISNFTSKLNCTYAKFNLEEAILISKQLAESIDDLISGDL
jgi:predicted transcriptional regulator